MDSPEKASNPEEILRNPLLNKGTAFSMEERDRLHLHGFLPYQISTIQDQVRRNYENFCKKRTQIGRYSFLSSLQNRNEVLFYKLLSEYMEEMLPLVYTPTVGDVSLQFSKLYSHARGIYFSYPLKDKIESIVEAIPRNEIDVIVVTDGERILGLGDLGSDGMAIPMGKLALYTLFGGINPGRCLPVLLDVGTNNQELLKDPMYLGWKNPRIQGKEYFAFVDRFVKAIQKRYPKVLLQWEDFGGHNAPTLLSQYREEICSFNDDIQGTAAVVLAGIFAAIQAIGSSLDKQRIVIFGGGSAGMGITEQIYATMQEMGVPEEQARSSFYIIDRDGLLHDKMTLSEKQKKFARNFETDPCFHQKQPLFLEDVVRNVHPTILIGASAQAKAFTENAIREMAKHTARPIIFPLSNPNSKAEASAEEIITWTKGAAIVATGSPFAPVFFEGKEHVVSQCNNVYIFPGLGLGVVASGARGVSDTMLHTAAKVLSECSPILQDLEAPLFPRFRDLREICKKIAFAVGKIAQQEGLAAKISDQELMEKIVSTMWTPEYKN